MLTPPEQNNPKSEDVPEKNLKRKASPVIEKLQLGRRIKKVRRVQSSNCQTYTYSQNLVQKFGPNYYYGTIEYVSDTFLSIIYDDGDDEAGYIHDNDLKLIQFVNSPEKKKKIIKYTEKTTKENPKCLFELQGLDKRNFEKKSLIPGISCSKQTFSVLEFYLFTYERQRMWERKTQNPLSTPYSRNERMSNYSFCNIYRELDRGTVYFKASILELFHKSRAWDMKEWTKQVLWRSYLYRLVNRVETFQNIDFAEPNKASLQKYIQRARAYWRKTSPFFTGAHNVSGFEPYISALSQSLNKLDATVDQFWSAPTSEDKLNVLLEMELVGDFFAWQIMCDMEMCGCVTIDYDFCVLGPGAKSKFLVVVVCCGSSVDLIVLSFESCWTRWSRSHIWYSKCGFAG